MVILSTNPLFSSSRSPRASVSKPPTFPVSSLTNLSLHLLPFNLSLPIVPYLRARAQFPPPRVYAPSPCVKAHVRLWVCACVKAHGQSGLCFLGDNNSLNSCRQTWRVHAQCVFARVRLCVWGWRGGGHREKRHCLLIKIIVSAVTRAHSTGGGSHAGARAPPVGSRRD